MGLASYLGAVNTLAEEIADSFSLDERDELFGLLQGMGFDAWVTWKAEHQQVIVKYVMSTPAQRGKSKAFMPI